MDYMANFNATGNDEESEYQVNNLTYSTKSTRLNFIKKVYSILLTQIAFTFILIMISIYNASYRLFFISNLWLFFVALVGSIITMYVMVYTSLSRKAS